jgi:hypothetical protein
MREAQQDAERSEGKGNGTQSLTSSFGVGIVGWCRVELPRPRAVAPYQRNPFAIPISADALL